MESLEAPQLGQSARIEGEAVNSKQIRYLWKTTEHHEAVSALHS